MKYRSNSNQDGFSAVELLITLIIASMFLFAGYQLYVQVTKDGTDANRTAILSNVVMSKLREKSSEISSTYTTGCTTASEAAIPNVVENVPGVGSVTFVYEVRCQNAAESIDVFRVKVKGTYNDAGINKTVEHATYVN